MNPRLVAISGPLKGSVFPITTEVMSVGRAEDNQVCFDDELVSKHHFVVQLKDGRAVLNDRETRNGTWINDRAYLEKILKNGDRIKCGSSMLLYLELDEDPDALPAIAAIADVERARNRERETLRADYTVRGEAAIYYKSVVQAFVKMAGFLNAVTDVTEPLAPLLDPAFEVTPALRGAILLNGRRVGPDPADFISQIYRERGFDAPARFVLSARVLADVYAERRPSISNYVTPVLCVPLMVSGTMRGVIYLEGVAPRSGFEPEHLYYLMGIAEFAVAAIRLASRVESIRDASDLLKEELHPGFEIVGKSELILNVVESIRKAAASDAPVLIIGETGTGKELVARGIYQMSKRVGKPFVAINCGGIVEGLLQSELFGHAKGAFTGAMEARKGKLKQADGGTVFLDEVGELTPAMQAALLRVLQGQAFTPVGKDQEVEVDVRVIAATNVDLDEAVQQKTFRQDLLYRLNVIVIEVPSLRDRPEDIPLLVDHFLSKHAGDRRVNGVAPEAMEAMRAYSWPGNIRELENVVRAAIVNGAGELVRREDLPKRVTETKPPSFRHIGRQAQKAAVQCRLKENGSDVAEAAAYFGVSKSYIYKLLSE